MALRKLNASFLKQLTETQELQREVGDLRDELSISEMRSAKLVQDIQQMQALATTPQQSQPSQSQLQSQQQQRTSSSSMQDGALDSSMTTNASSSSPTTSEAQQPVIARKKSMQGVITRKSSFGYSRPSRWSGHRVSQRSSLSSNGTRSSVMYGGVASGTNSTFGAVPPVPPLPRRRPTDIVTDASTRSTAMISTETPNTEVRAMMRAQDELYRMLGISLGDRRMRRSHSIIGLPGNPETQPHPSTTSMNFLQPPTAAGAAAATRISRADSLDSGEMSNRASRANTRPQSYPASLLEAYNPLDADVRSLILTPPIEDYDF
ncbi:hypothetical protein NP233_g12237 [Leucocoprinus birnbaumii]|uniref:Uncharacterized protein n=1 Tax=Leucocoprinus birnbaumii TaxID=56174 RepID=A0AAD5YJM2_9AGAR|nr:hypothetical protein NP233_g12237 [Leucocoprinus birnbaumii]